MSLRRKRHRTGALGGSMQCPSGHSSGQRGVVSVLGVTCKVLKEQKGIARGLDNGQSVSN